MNNKNEFIVEREEAAALFNGMTLKAFERWVCDHKKDNGEDLPFVIRYRGDAWLVSRPLLMKYFSGGGVQVKEIHSSKRGPKRKID